MATPQLLATDRLQSPLLAIGAAGRSNNAYTPYGYRPKQPSAPALGFTGQLREREIGWYLLGNGHRAYNPVLMRFHSPDRLSPFGAGGLNAYAYCHGDPINFQDPSGRNEIVGGGLNVLVGGIAMYLIPSLYRKIKTKYINKKARGMGVPRSELGDDPTLGGVVIDGLAIAFGTVSAAMGAPAIVDSEGVGGGNSTYSAARETVSMLTAVVTTMAQQNATQTKANYNKSNNAYKKAKDEAYDLEMQSQAVPSAVESGIATVSQHVENEGGPLQAINSSVRSLSV